MCGCRLSRNSLLIYAIAISTYFHIGFCGLKFLKRVGVQPYYNVKRTDISNNIQSPCPTIFQYKYDQFGRIRGALQIHIPNAKAIDLEVELCVGNRVNQGAEGSISLPYIDAQEIITHILQKQPLEYTINFPEWRGFQPKITRIIMNGNVICSDQPYPPNSVPILTMINLRHRLQMNITPLSSAIPSSEYDQNNYGTNPFLDVRNNGFMGNRGNPFNFNPSFPEVTPEVIYKPEADSESSPYPRNPFFNTMSSTIRPKVHEGINYSKNNTIDNNWNRPISSPQIEPTEPSIRQPYPEPISDTEANGRTPQYFGDICGRPVVTNSLVLNGHPVPRGAFPWLTAMFVTTNIGLEYQCTGSLISRRHVVTAAHCVKQGTYVIDSDKVILIMGRMSIQGWGASDGESIIGAEDIFVHPNYKSSTADADISLIFMKAEVTFSKFIRPICLWIDNDDLNLVVGRTGIVVGWGRDETGRKVSPEPKQIELPIVSQEQCLRSNNTFVEITSERTFCAGNRNGSGPCNGDSGSGFVMLENGRWFLKGIVSMSLSDPYTRTCDLSNYVVFTDASKYSGWLSSFMDT